MDKLAVQSRYTRINSWYGPPRLVRFSARLVRQFTGSAHESARATKGRDGRKAADR